MSGMRSTILIQCTGGLVLGPKSQAACETTHRLVGGLQPPHDGRSPRPRNRPGKLPPTGVAGQGRIALCGPWTAAFVQRLRDLG